MRKITKQAVTAFFTRKPFKRDNTEVRNELGYTWLILHGNKIAQRNNGILCVSTGGWNTPTTRERLNGLPGVKVWQKDHTLYLNGKEWDGDWAVIGGKDETLVDSPEAP